MLHRINLYPWPGMDAEKVVSKLAKAGFNSLCVQAKPVDGVSLINTGFFPGGDGSLLDRIIDIAKKEGMEVVGRISLMCDIRLSAERSDLLSYARNSMPLVHPYVDLDWYGFLCPDREEIISAYLDFVETLLSERDLDAVALEYVGYAFARQENRRVLACYCFHCRERFRQETGQDPIEVSQLSEQWVNWRVSNVARNLRALAKVVKRNSARLEVVQDQDDTPDFRIESMYRRALGIRLDLLRDIVDRFVPRARHSQAQVYFRQLKHFRQIHGMDLVSEVARECIKRPEDYLYFLKAAEAAGCSISSLEGFGAVHNGFDLDMLWRISELVSSLG